MSIYTPPKSDLEQLSGQNEKRIKLGKILSYLSLTSLITIGGFVSFVNHIAKTLNKISVSNPQDPSILSGELSQSLVPILTSLIFSLPGIVCIFFVLFFTSYRVKNFYRVWLVIAIVLLLSLPFGTLFGLALLIVLYIKKNEFTKIAYQAPQKSLAKNKAQRDAAPPRPLGGR